MLLQDKSVVITGAGSGVGRAASLIFAREGARVVCADINEDWAQQTAELVREAGGRAVSVLCDVSDRSAVDAAVDRAVSEFGRLDVMYNNAGVATTIGTKRVTLIEQDEDDFQRLVSINLGGVIFGCQVAVRTFIRQGGGGVIVNTASVAGLVGWGGVMYGATKGGVVQLTRGLAVEVAPHGIRVNSVCPGGMYTNFGRTGGEGFGEIPEDKRQALGSFHPLGRPILPEECANAALFLASDLSSNVTGVNVPVDGGYCAA